MKAEDIRRWLDEQTNPDDEVWIDDATLVLDGSAYVLDRLEVGLQPGYDKAWREADVFCVKCGSATFDR